MRWVADMTLPTGRPVADATLFHHRLRQLLAHRDMLRCGRNVCSLGNCGRDVLALSLTGFDPLQTWLRSLR
jgi:hypothetical protein